MRYQIQDLTDYFSTNWVDDSEEIRSAYCKQIDQLYKQLNVYDGSLNISQELIDSLDSLNITYNDELYSIRSIFNTLLRFPEKHQILVREQESEAKELANQRGKIYSSFIRNDVLDIPLTGIEIFLPWYDKLVKVMHKCGSTIDQSIQLGQIKRSIKHPDDIANVDCKC